MKTHEGGSISRRSFLAGAALLGGGALSAAAMGPSADVAYAGEDATAEPTGEPLVKNPQYSFEYIPEPIDESLITETIEAEIVVVGAGVASMGATMYAASRGANVHVLEKSSEPGVHRLCVAGVNPSIAEQMGCPKINEKDFAEDLWRYSGNLQGNFPVISRYAKDSGKYIDWLFSEITKKGWSFIPMGNNSTPGTVWNEYQTMFMWMNDKGESGPTAGVSPDWVQLQADIAEEYGAVFHFNQPAVRLEREGHFSGRVTSVISQDYVTGEYRRYKASKGVILCAGDFYNDKDMVHKYCRHLEKATFSIAEPNNTGDMHKAALWVGADMDAYSAGDLFGFQNAKNINWGLAPEPDDPDYSPMRNIVAGCMWVPALATYPMLWVDDTGKRFINEATNCMMQSTPHVVMSNPHGLAWTIWDSAWESKLPEDADVSIPALIGPSASELMGCNTQRQIDKEVEAGLTQKYDTIEELIAGCGFDSDIFQATLERYNYLCDRGEDLDCFKDAKWLTKLDTPPYYATHWGTMVTSTRCGLKTDERSRVLDVDGLPIEGLYAAGNNGGNFYGIAYPGSLIGTGIGHGQFFAWTAARDILGEEVIYTEEAKEA